MDFPQSVAFLYQLSSESRTMKLGLDRMRELCRALGNPQDQLRIIHVAGTNGKGSTCAMIEAGLRAAGYRTGLYTSPHLVSPVERIRINGEPVTEEQFAQLFERVHRVATGLPEHPTYFETITAMGWLAFVDAACDWAVVEVGLGGRLDATNVVRPARSVITPISFDHQQYLGHTLAAIAGEKAGIMKQGIPVIVSAQEPEAWEVIATRARELSAPLLPSAGAQAQIPPPLLGEHQRENTRTAVRTLESLGIDPAGIAFTRWPGRLERVRQAPEIYLDGAHNVAGVRALARFIRDLRAAGRRIWIVFGVMRDKDVVEMTSELFPLADELILTAPRLERALPATEIPSPDFARIAPRVSIALEMLESARPDDAVFITGSLFLVGEARALLVKTGGLR